MYQHPNGFSFEIQRVHGASEVSGDTSTLSGVSGHIGAYLPRKVALLAAEAVVIATNMVRHRQLANSTLQFRVAHLVFRLGGGQYPSDAHRMAMNVLIKKLKCSHGSPTLPPTVMRAFNLIYDQVQILAREDPRSESSQSILCGSFTALSSVAADTIPSTPELAFTARLLGEAALQCSKPSLLYEEPGTQE